MALILDVRVDGEPKGQPRPRAFVRNGHARVYDAGTAEGWKSLVAAAVGPHLPTAPLEGPVSVEMDFHMPRPKSLLRKKDPDGLIPHTAKPDADNLAKAVADTLTQVGLWRDDSQICEMLSRKVYARKNSGPGMDLRVYTVTGVA